MENEDDFDEMDMNDEEKWKIIKINFLILNLFFKTISIAFLNVRSNESLAQLVVLTNQLAKLVSLSFF